MAGVGAMVMHNLLLKSSPPPLGKEKVGVLGWFRMSKRRRSTSEKKALYEHDYHALPFPRRAGKLFRQTALYDNDMT